MLSIQSWHAINSGHIVDCNTRTTIRYQPRRGMIMMYRHIWTWNICSAVHIIGYFRNQFLFYRIFQSLWVFGGHSGLVSNGRSCVTVDYVSRVDRVSTLYWQHLVLTTPAELHSYLMLSSSSSRVDQMWNWLQREGSCWLRNIPRIFQDVYILCNQQTVRQILFSHRPTFTIKNTRNTHATHVSG